MKKRVLSILMAVVLICGLAVPASAANNTFVDVPESYWAHDAIVRAAAAGVVNGIGDDKFNPEGALTMAHFVVIMTRAFYSDEVKEAAAVNKDYWWYAPNETVAKKHDLLDGMNSVAWGEAVTRYQMALIMRNIMRDKGTQMPSEAELSAVQSKIGDWENIPAAYLEAVATMFHLGLITGTDDKGTFNGLGTMKRSHCAVIWSRMADYMESGPVITVPEDTTVPEDSTDPAGGNGTASNATAINAINDVGKDKAYPTYGSATTANANGYYTKANVDIAGSKLDYSFLTYLNTYLVSKGYEEASWVSSDEAEEYTLMRAKEAASTFAHTRPDGSGVVATENLAKGYSSTTGVLNAWKNSAGHNVALLAGGGYEVCVARYGNYWVYTQWSGNTPTTIVTYASNNYYKN